jgi:outer membrane biosynthesis protein TonB
MDRAEQAGFGASIAGHLLLFAALVASYSLMPPLRPPERPAIEVDLVSETALESGAPEISNEAPAPKLAEEEAPVEPEPPAPVPVPEPKPIPKIEPKPAPRQTARPEPKPQPRKTQTGGRLTGILEGLAPEDSPGRSNKAPAANLTPQVQSSLAAAVRRQLKPYWKAPTGADAEQLRTELAITLARDGSVIDIDVLRQTGVTPSNRAQAPLHVERAIKAVELASPFQLPAEYYDAWKLLKPIGFDKRLSQ